MEGDLLVFLLMFVRDMVPGTGIVAVIALTGVGGTGAGSSAGKGAVRVKLEQVEVSARVISATGAGTVFRGGGLLTVLEELSGCFLGILVVGFLDAFDEVFKHFLDRRTLPLDVRFRVSAMIQIWLINCCGFIAC